MSKEYNGWANYETWRVMLEYFDGATAEDLTGDEDRKITPAECREIIDEFIHENNRDTHPTVLDWAASFVARVDWQEVADAINED